MGHPRSTVLAASSTIHDREPSSMCAAFQRVVAARAGEIALRTAGGGPSYTWAQYADRVALIAGGLAVRGVRRADAVALLLTNRPESHVVDTAAQHLGAVPFSCYNTSSPEQLGYLLKASGARVVVTERLLAPAVQRFLDDPESPLSLLILVHGPRMGEDVGGSDTEETEASEDGAGNDVPPAGRVEAGGGNDAPSAGRGEAGGGNDAPPAAAAAVEQSVEIGRQFLRATAAGRVPDDLKALHNAADQRVLAPLRAKLGLDQVCVAVTAAAPTPPEVVESVNAIGVPLVEAWGMAEVAGMGTMVPLGAVRPGSIGLPIPGLEVRLLDDGELLVRGPVVTRGHHRQPEETAAVHGIRATDPVSLSDHPVVQAAVSAGVQAANATLSRVEHIRAYELLPEVWMPGGDLVTPTMKVRRRAVLQQYADRVDALYAAR